jgi:hypothetical protein
MSISLRDERSTRFFVSKSRQKDGFDAQRQIKPWHLRIDGGNSEGALLSHTPRGHGSKGRDRGKAGGGKEKFHGAKKFKMSLVGKKIMSGRRELFLLGRRREARARTKDFHLMRDTCWIGGACVTFRCFRPRNRRGRISSGPYVVNTYVRFGRNVPFTSDLARKRKIVFRRLTHPETRWP